MVRRSLERKEINMSEKDKDLMERYIYEVVRRLPKEQREDIAMELRELIGDMMEERCSDADDLSDGQDGADTSVMQQILESLGDPAEFAKKYRDEGSYLIGPEYYDNYIWILKIVMVTAVAVAIFSAAIDGIMESGMTSAIFGMWIGEALGGGIGGAISAFGSVTLIFALLERHKVKVDLSNARGSWKVKNLEEGMASPKVWTPLELPPVPDKRAMISRSDCVVSIVFILLFCGFLALTPELFGILRFEDGQLLDSVCIFNLEQWSLILPVFICSLLVGMVDEIVKLVHGYYCKTVMYCSIACGIVQMVLAVVLMKVLPLWNPSFEEQLRALDWSFLEGKEPMVYWDPITGSNLILMIIIFITLVEMGVTVYKTWKYGVDVK